MSVLSWPEQWETGALPGDFPGTAEVKARNVERVATKDAKLKGAILNFYSGVNKRKR